MKGSSDLKKEAWAVIIEADETPTLSLSLTQLLSTWRDPNHTLFKPLSPKKWRDYSAIYWLLIFL